MHAPIDFLQVKKDKDLKKIRKKSGYSEVLEKQGTFVARFPYPMEIGDIINFLERMGIVNEEKIMPELYKIQRNLEIEFDEW